MKIHICYQTRNAPFGGGNQFLKALKKKLEEHSSCIESAADADCILFSSFEYTLEAAALKRSFPEKTFVHRIDGPLRLYNRPSDPRDAVANAANAAIADATIFQSRWSREKNLELGFKPVLPDTVIMNAPDPSVFFPPSRTVGDGGKIRLIAASWSSNWKKGFQIYRWLDENLDFGRYEMTFVGNSPVQFRNIKALKPLSSADLADLLRQSDIFITASENDPCSNSLIEAMHCGLPALALKSGGHPEIIGGAGRLFEKPGEIPQLLEEITGDYAAFRAAISLPSLDSVTADYVAFIESAVQRADSERERRLDTLRYLRLLKSIASWKMAEFIGRYWK